MPLHEQSGDPMKPSQERRERILALKARGLTSTQIGIRLGMSAAAVRVALAAQKRSMAFDEVKKKS